MLAQTTVVIPARNERATIHPLVRCILPHVADVVVVDSASTDETAYMAEQAGARVVRSPLPGKGRAVVLGLDEVTTRLVAVIDGDLQHYTADRLQRLTEPLSEPDVVLTKAAYRLRNGERRGGRVTEHTARPLLRLLYPHLADLATPLSGEWACETRWLRAQSWPSGYGIDVAVLIAAHAAVAEVNLQHVWHDPQPEADLYPMAVEVAAAILFRRDLPGTEPVTPLREAVA